MTPPLKRMAALGAAAALSIGVAACGGSSNTSSAATTKSSSSHISVGLIIKEDSNPYFVSMKQAAQNEADKLGVKLIVAAGKNDTDNQSQVTAIENMITAGVKGILITPADTKAVVPTIQKARQQGVEVIALDTPTQPQTATDGLFATNNFTAGELIGRYAKAAMAGKQAKIAMIDLAPGISVGVLRHDGFLKGFGITDNSPEIVGKADAQGDQTMAQTAMENLLQKAPDLNLVYTINEPSALGAYTALKQAGKQKGVTIVSIDGGCQAIKQGLVPGEFVATSQQYPGVMANDGVKAVVDFAKTGKKASGYRDTGVNLITDHPLKGVPSQSVSYGEQHCWG
jgi:fructose transport system substrate-binding protein